MNKKYEALESMCQNALESGVDIEACLVKFPELADELRPLLQAAVDAKSAAPAPAPDDVTRRGRAHLLQHAAQMRASASVPRRASFFDFRLAAVALTLLLVFFTGGTGLVSASASALPGDSLYPVKRGWESAHFWFADDARTASLVAEHEEERREEVQELLGGGKLAAVRFEGIVTLIDEIKWQIADIPVILSTGTEVDALINIGSDVIVNGETQSNGTVLATKIALSGHSEGHSEMPSEILEDESEEVVVPVKSKTAEPDDDEVVITKTVEPDDSESDDNNEKDDGEEEDGTDNPPAPDPDDDESDNEPDDEDEEDD